MPTLTALPPAVQARIAKIYRDFGRILVRDADDPTDYAPRFQPSPADEAWAARTSPLNIADDEARALDALHAALEDDRDFCDRYPAEIDSWEEYDALVNDNGQFGCRRDEG